LEIEIMSLRIGIENGTEGRTIAWVLEHPGCTSYGKNSQEALQNLPAALREYNEWLIQHQQESWKVPVDQEILIEDIWDVYQIDDNYEAVPDGYEVNAWFRHDWKPLTEVDIERGLSLLSWSRNDLLNSVKGLEQEVLDEKHPGERWSISGILNHIGGAEWWYLDRLGLAFSREEVPVEPGERLEKVRNHLVTLLPNLVDSKQVTGINGEFWSPRKVLRRAIWHERDHTFHIKKLLSL
jgi:predicted RNase H-like HicB family nuclease